MAYEWSHPAKGANPSTCVSVGYQAGYNDIGMYNVCSGGFALYGKKSGNNNVAIGYQAGKSKSGATIENNTLIGCQAGTKLESSSKNNVMLGYQAGNLTTTGSYNILIGSGANTDSPTDSRKLNIGNLLKGSLLSTDMYLLIAGDLRLPEIPTTDPQIAGAVWNDNGTLKISM